MVKEKIATSIESLRAEIDNLDVDDTAAKARLGALVRQLEGQLDESDQRGLTELDSSVNELIEDFGVKHPRIAGILNDLMVTLSGMGI